MKHIFVFGSNLSGIHGAGAAKYAHEKLGAEWGVGEGLTGCCYALPTKDHKIKTRTLGEISVSVQLMVLSAYANPDMLYKVTPIGTGLAGYTKTQIQGCFQALSIPDNVVFTKQWFQEVWT